MNTYKVLWVDDHWREDAEHQRRTDLERWERELVHDLESHQIRLTVARRGDGLVGNELINGQYDCIILDYELVADDGSVETNAFQLLDQWRTAMRRLPTVAIFSRYGSAAQLRAHLLSFRGIVWGVFDKTSTGAVELAQFLRNTIEKGPLNFIVISDLHAGFVREAGGIDPAQFVQSLGDSIAEIASQYPLDGLILPGDLAWRDQNADLTQAFLSIRKLRYVARLDRPEQIVFCPGNHDLDLSDGADKWRYFGDFVDLLAQGQEENFSSRFVVAWNPTIHRRDAFRSQESLLSVVFYERRAVVFACLNSCAPTGKGFEVKAVIDEAQWNSLDRVMQALPSRTLRIAVLHHPIFSAPGGLYKDEPSIEDQGKSMQLLAKHGFGLVLHGHAHFAGIHSHRIRTVNSTTRDNNVTKILTIACPSVSAEPNSTSPQRQYFLLRLGALSARTKTRDVTLSTRIFNPAKRTWSVGEEVAAGEFEICSSE